ncbi:MAG TPA: type II toxin-antitoxin system RelE/ParE family toxin [Allosphingosinicella sp.]
MTHKPVFSATAEEDVVALYDWIAEAAGTDVAADYVTRLLQRCEKLTDYPDKGTPREDISSGLRTAPFERRTLIAYRVSADEVVVLRILSGGRDLTSAFS